LAGPATDPTEHEVSTLRITTETESLDLRQRRRIGRTLLALRRDAGRDPNAAIHGRTVRDLECSHNWNALLVMAWARFNGRILTFSLGDLIIPPDGDIDALAYEDALRRAERPQDVDLMHLRLVHRNLFRARRAAGVSDTELAEHLGASADAVRLFDANPDTVTLAALQRYTRVLGGRMRPVLANRRPPARRRPANVLTPALAAANSVRALDAGARHAVQARALLETRGPELSAQDATFLRIRAARPTATLAELAAGCGVTKDRYSSRLRRLLRAAERTS
jgi:hypothetical protein